MGIDGNETAGQLARESSSHPLTEAELVISISANVARGGNKGPDISFHRGPVLGNLEEGSSSGDFERRMKGALG